MLMAVHVLDPKQMEIRRLRMKLNILYIDIGIISAIDNNSNYHKYITVCLRALGVLSLLF